MVCSQINTNGTPGRDGAVVGRGAQSARTVAEAVEASPVVVACLYDHASVHETLDPVVDQLRGRTLVNLTTTTPGEARELGGWAAEHGIDHLDGAIMAVPAMIGSREAQIFYSGSRTAFEHYHGVFDAWATSVFDGDDAGMASLFDLAMLSGMYVMFTGFLHGAALMGASGVSASDFAARQAPFLAAMTSGFADYARVIDGGDYTVPEQQTLEWSDPVLGYIQRTSEEQSVSDAPIALVRGLVHPQIEAGFGGHGLARFFESLRQREG